jgi:hypothetical protein
VWRIWEKSKPRIIKFTKFLYLWWISKLLIKKPGIGFEIWKVSRVTDMVQECKAETKISSVWFLRLRWDLQSCMFRTTEVFSYFAHDHLEYVKLGTTIPLRGFPTVWKVFLKVFYRKTVNFEVFYAVGNPLKGVVEAIWSQIRYFFNCTWPSSTSGIVCN